MPAARRGRRGRGGRSVETRGHRPGRAGTEGRRDGRRGDRAKPVKKLRRGVGRTGAEAGSPPSRQVGRPRERRRPRDATPHDRHPPADRRAAGRGPADRRDPDDLQRGRHVARSWTCASKYKDAFKEKHGVGLGFMSFFVKAAIEALQGVPRASTPGSTAATSSISNYYDIGVAVSTERGPDGPGRPRRRPARASPRSRRRSPSCAVKARDGKIAVGDLQGGTFTITNGGVFGSLLSTPILNPPQSGILGMHAIQKRPVAVDDQVVIRPMMYLALSYDHRIDRRPRGGQLPGPDQGMHREPRAADAGDLKRSATASTRTQRDRSQDYGRLPTRSRPLRLAVALTRGVSVAERYDLVVIGAGPGRLRRRDPGGAARHEGRLRREAADPGRHLPEHRLHPQQGPARLERAVPPGQARGSPGTASRSASSALDLAGDARPQGRGRQGADRRRRASCSRRTRSTPVFGTARLASPEHGRGHATSDGGETTLEAGHILLATGSEPVEPAVPAVRRQDDRQLDRGPGVRPGARAPGRRRRRLHRPGAGLGLEAARGQGHGHRVPAADRAAGRRRDRRGCCTRAWPSRGWSSTSRPRSPGAKVEGGKVTVTAEAKDGKTLAVRRRQGAGRPSAAGPTPTGWAWPRSASTSTPKTGQGRRSTSTSRPTCPASTRSAT